jgi:ribonuclease HI
MAEMELYVDGGCSGNGQLDLTKRRMVAVVCLPDATVVHESTHEGGSNNIAELLALEAAYRWAVTQGIKAVTIYTDSRNNLSWGQLKTPGKNINDRPRVLEIQARLAKFFYSVRATVRWVSRDHNVAGWHIEAKYRL